MFQTEGVLCASFDEKSERPALHQLESIAAAFENESFVTIKFNISADDAHGICACMHSFRPDMNLSQGMEWLNLKYVYACFGICIE